MKNSNSWLQESHEKIQKKHEKHKREVLESKEYQKELSNYIKTISDFGNGLKFCQLMAMRSPDFINSNLFFQNLDHFFESSVALIVLGKEGMRNPARRELRYLIELALNSLFVDQQLAKGTLEEKLIYLKRKVDTSSIRHLKDISFYLLKDEKTKNEFIAEIKSGYGTACNYVHTSTKQIQERLELKRKGIGLGFDTEKELKELRNEVFNVLSLVLIFSFHSLGPSLTGDLIVDGLDRMDGWMYHRSKYYAEVDSNYDYKAERQNNLKEIKRRRAQRVKS